MSVDEYTHMHTFSKKTKTQPHIVAMSFANITIKEHYASRKQESLWKTFWNQTQGFFSKDQTLAALRHARNRQYLCVYSLTPFWWAQPLCVYIEGDKSENSMDATLPQGQVGGRVGGGEGGASHHHHHHRHRHQHWPARARAGIHAANCLLIPEAIISSCLLVYILALSLKELWRIMCPRVSFLYCQNVSVSNQLGERGWYTVKRVFLLPLFEAIWTFFL